MLNKTAQQMYDEAMEEGACTVEITEGEWLMVTDEGTWTYFTAKGSIAEVTWDDARGLLNGWVD